MPRSLVDPDRRYGDEPPNFSIGTASVTRKVGKVDNTEPLG